VQQYQLTKNPLIVIPVSQLSELMVHFTGYAMAEKMASFEHENPTQQSLF
jgi:hypothetical protein